MFKDSSVGLTYLGMQAPLYYMHKGRLLWTKILYRLEALMVRAAQASEAVKIIESYRTGIASEDD